MASLIELVSDTETTSEDFAITTHSPAGGKRAVVIVASAVNNSGTINIDVTGGGTTWAESGALATETDYGSRRSLKAWESVGALTSADINVAQVVSANTWQESMWAVLEISDHATDMIPDGQTRGGLSSSGTSADHGSDLTIDTDNIGVFVVAVEQDSISGFAFEGGMTQVTAVTGGSDVRRLYIGTMPDSGDGSMSATWTGTSLWGTLAFVIDNGSESSGGGGGGGGAPLPGPLTGPLAGPFGGPV